MECAVALVEVMLMGIASYAIVFALDAVWPGCVDRFAERIGLGHREW